MRYLIADWRPTCSPNTAVIHSELRDLSKYLKHKHIGRSDNVCPSVFFFSFLIIIFFLILAFFYVYFFSIFAYSFYYYFSLLHTLIFSSFRLIFSSFPFSFFSSSFFLDLLFYSFTRLNIALCNLTVYISKSLLLFPRILSEFSISISIYIIKSV